MENDIIYGERHSAVNYTRNKEVFRPTSTRGVRLNGEEVDLKVSGGDYSIDNETLFGVLSDVYTSNFKSDKGKNKEIFKKVVKLFWSVVFLIIFVCAGLCFMVNRSVNMSDVNNAALGLTVEEQVAFTDSYYLERYILLYTYELPIIDKYIDDNDEYVFVFYEEDYISNIVNKSYYKSHSLGDWVPISEYSSSVLSDLEMAEVVTDYKAALLGYSLKNTFECFSNLDIIEVGSRILEDIGLIAGEDAGNVSYDNNISEFSFIGLFNRYLV